MLNYLKQRHCLLNCHCLLTAELIEGVDAKNWMVLKEKNSTLLSITWSTPIFKIQKIAFSLIKKWKMTPHNSERQPQMGRLITLKTLLS